MYSVYLATEFYLHDHLLINEKLLLSHKYQKLITTSKALLLFPWSIYSSISPFYKKNNNTHKIEIHVLKQCFSCLNVGPWFQFVAVLFFPNNSIMLTFRAQLSVTVFIFSFMANELNFSVEDYQTFPGSSSLPASQPARCFGNVSAQNTHPAEHIIVFTWLRSQNKCYLN